MFENPMRKQVRSKYIIRERGGQGILGIFYEPPELVITDPREGKHDAIKGGRFVIGGPTRFEEMRDEIVSHFNRKGELELVKWRNYGNKSLWFLTGVEGVEMVGWLDGIHALMEAGYQVQKVTGFKRLLW